MVHKGAAKRHVTREWFKKQYRDMSLTTKVKVINPFRVNLKEMSIRKQESEFTLSIPDSTKRERILDKKTGLWVDT